MHRISQRLLKIICLKPVIIDSKYSTHPFTTIAFQKPGFNSVQIYINFNFSAYRVSSNQQQNTENNAAGKIQIGGSGQS